MLTIVEPLVFNKAAQVCIVFINSADPVPSETWFFY